MCNILVDGPAYRAGLRRGDIITSVDNSPALEVEQLRGQEGDQRAVEWLRGDETHKAIVTIGKCREASLDTLQWLGDDVALISIHSFSYRVYDPQEVEQFFLDAHEAKAIILDLRTNAGGTPDNTRHLLGQLLPPDAKLFGDVYKSTECKYRRRFPNEPTQARAIVDKLNGYYTPIRGRLSPDPYQGRVIVLIDAGNGSGGEVTPAVLQDHKRATLVGTRTAGAVRASVKFRIRGGYFLKTPIGELVMVGGSMIEGVGVTPDVKLTAVQTASDEYLIPFAVDLATDDSNQLCPAEP